MDGQGAIAVQADVSRKEEVAALFTACDRGLGTPTALINNAAVVGACLMLLGNGGGEFEFPTAVIDCPTRVDPPLSQTLDGRASYDPNGLPIVDYAWSIKDTPRGSTGTILDPAPDQLQRPGRRPRLPGRT